MTIINQKSISGITSITFASAGDDLLTFHSNNGTERFRIDNSGNTKITAGIVTTLTVTGTTTLNGNLDLQDNDKILAGTGDDLEFYHDGTHSHIVSNTGNLRILADGSGSLVLTSKAGEEAITCAQDGAVAIKHDNSTKFTTTSTGVTITGTATADGLSLGDSEYAYFGAGNDLQIYHDSSNSRIKNTTGSLWLQSDTGIRFTDADVNESMAAFYDNGAVELYYDGSKKFETTNTGVKIDNSSTTDMILFDVGGSNFAKLGHNSASGTDILDIRSEGHTRFLTNGNNERVRIHSSGKISTGGESSPDVSAGGLCLDQNAEDGIILSFKSSDIAHGITDYDETDTYFSARKVSGDKGGLKLRAYTDAAGGDPAFQFQGFINSDTDGSYVPFAFIGGKKSGTTVTNISSNRRILEVKNADGTRSASFTASGITFGNDTAAANALDDYEEGTFTATCDNSVTLHSDTNLLQYVKIGSSVTVMGQIRVNSGNSGSSLTINNLPFTVSSSGEGSAFAVGAVRLYSADMASDHKYVVAIADGGSTNLQFQGVRDNATSQGLGATDNGYYMFSVTYRTTT